MEKWHENKLVQDDADIAYEPEDKEGRKLAAFVTLQFRLIMWRVKMQEALKHTAQK